MTRFRTAAGALLLLAAALPARARAQGEDARVLPRGWVELRGSGIYTQFNSRFGSGGQEPLGATFATQLQPLAERLLAPLVPPLQTGLNGFFTGTAGQVQNPVTPAAVSGGTVAAGLAGDFRRAPFTLSYGLTRRIMVGVTVPFERNATSVSALLLRGGTVGVNPAADSNAALLGRISASYAELGRAAVLPVAGTAAAVELQRRVLALTGDTLALPARAVSLTTLLGSEVLAALLTDEEQAALTSTSAATPFQLGDVEVGARIQLVNGVRGYPFPDSARGSGFRSTLAVNLRLPTASRADTFFLLVLPRERGHFGLSADVYNDVFLAPKFWLTASAGYTQLVPANVLRRAFSAARPFPGDTAVRRTLRRQPGARIRLSLMPRYRLTRELSFAAAYQFEHAGATTYTAQDDLGEVLPGPVERTDAWTTHSFGVGASYSTIGAFMRGRAAFPLEFSILYRNSVAGSGFGPHAGTIEAGGRILYQLVGRPRRTPSDTTATDTARALPAPPPPAVPPSAVPPGGRPDITPRGERPTQPAPGQPTPRPAPPPPPPPPTSAPPPE
ncbi:MAG TPA: hypothetical protein VF541_03625 [Longimicrobium sp.]|jgi:hypothetical protein